MRGLWRNATSCCGGNTVSMQGLRNHEHFLIKNDLCSVFYLQSAESSWRQDQGKEGGGAFASLQEAGVVLGGQQKSERGSGCKRDNEVKRRKW